jgi:shikimate kinase
MPNMQEEYSINNISSHWNTMHVISNGGSHFIDKTFRAFLKELAPSTTLLPLTILKQASRPRQQINRSRMSYRK